MDGVTIKRENANIEICNVYEEAFSAPNGLSGAVVRRLRPLLHHEAQQWITSDDPQQAKAQGRQLLL
jgi:hypothetical protein